MLDYWEAKDPVPTHRALLLELGVDEDDLHAMEVEEASAVEQALEALDAMPWPEPATVTEGVTSLHGAERTPVTSIGSMALT